MRVIPVLDLKHGLVVRARAGDRAAYAPIVTPLSPTSELLDVAAGLMSVARFDALYIADLDAIEGRRGNLAAIAALAKRWPDVEIWLDDGLREASGLAERLAIPGLRPVIGTESQEDAAVLRAVGARGVLSLDFKGETYAGPPTLLDPACWPEDVIVMTLGRVGTGGGPDLNRLRDIQGAGARRVFAAGGVRGPADLETLKAMGVAGALVATALHAGTLTGDDVRRLGDC
ncbi:HisA/HisF-related TIM barrel protein [Chthonobacter albigriseus]|uniref:HisA/HisF-related TIM barrel protein n=1 Tax=Chthonobacter albigriseus TaxID=1683161 RepID=UPI0015EF3DA7|nr:HisA/HisF-related TIM barrel protein [Chthonobacter albigriseus]